jgi:hypothetical protein
MNQNLNLLGSINPIDNDPMNNMSKVSKNSGILSNDNFLVV